jgi:hypothetical protein
MNKYIRNIISIILYSLNPFERILLSKLKESERIDPPPIFIIGAPRTGSTFLYQLITNYFDVNYISNLTALFYKALYFGFIFNNKIYKNKTHNSYESEFGRTEKLNSPSESGKFWYRWFPKDKHYVDEFDVNIENLSYLKKTFNAITNVNKKPLIIKNLNCGQRLKVLHKIFPEALIIYITRDHLETSLSLLKSREKIRKDKNKWVSVRPKNYKDLIELNYIEQVVNQIYYIENQIDEDLNLFSEKQVMKICYNALINDIEKILSVIKFFFKNNNIEINFRDGYKKPIVKKSLKPDFSNPDTQLIMSEIKKFKCKSKIE